MTNLEWIGAGNTGCTFATLFARNPEKVGWVHMNYDEVYWDGKMLICSLEFPSDWTVKQVRQHCLDKMMVMYEEDLGEGLGLRIDMVNAIPKTEKNSHNSRAMSWVQYFGPDSHVVTRRTPNPMIMWTRKLNPLGYVKQVGFSGILHLAHAFASHITDKVADVLWKRSYEQTTKKLGKPAGEWEAAKVTWLKKDVL